MKLWKFDQEPRKMLTGLKKNWLNFYSFPKYIMGYSTMLKERVLKIQGKLDLITKKDCLAQQIKISQSKVSISSIHI